MCMHHEFYDMQMLRNARLFSPVLAWKGLFQHLEGPPMDDYHEFRRDHVNEIEEWRQHWSPSYVYIIYGGVASGGTITPSIPSTSTQFVPPPLFNPITELFLRLKKKNYQLWYTCICVCSRPCYVYVSMVCQRCMLYDDMYSHDRYIVIDEKFFHDKV